MIDPHFQFFNPCNVKIFQKNFAISCNPFVQDTTILYIVLKFIVLQLYSGYQS